MNKIRVLLISLGIGLLCGCEKDDTSEQQNMVRIPSLVVANGDYLTSVETGPATTVKYYWDGQLVQTTKNNEGLKYLINNQKHGSKLGESRSEGDHILKVEYPNSSYEFLIQVYDKELGYFGCIIDREVKSVQGSKRCEIKNGQNLTGAVIYFPLTGTMGFYGTMRAAKIYIDESETPTQTIDSAPFNFNIPINGLPQGKHKLTIEGEGVGFGRFGNGGGWVLVGDASTDYEFYVIE